jgi:hypothetical protein
MRREAQTPAWRYDHPTLLIPWDVKYNFRSGVSSNFFCWEISPHIHTFH